MLSLYRYNVMRFNKSRWRQLTQAAPVYLSTDGHRSASSADNDISAACPLNLFPVNRYCDALSCLSPASAPLQPYPVGTPGCFIGKASVPAAADRNGIALFMQICKSRQRRCS
ncbi:hypothetical protein D3C75_576270 [compost metagenome]